MKACGVDSRTPVLADSHCVCPCGALNGAHTLDEGRALVAKACTRDGTHSVVT